MDLQLWEKHFHGVLQRSSFLRLLVLVVIDKLIQTEKAVQPAAGVGVLKIDEDLVHNLGPPPGEVVLHDLADTDRQLYPDDVGGTNHGLNNVVPKMGCCNM